MLEFSGESDESVLIIVICCSLGINTLITHRIGNTSWIIYIYIVHQSLRDFHILSDALNDFLVKTVFFKQERDQQPICQSTI